MLGAQIRCWVCHCLDLDEPAQAANLIEVDTNVLPEQEMPILLHDDEYIERIAESVLQAGRVADIYEPVATLPRHRFVGALIGDELSDSALLAQLQPAVGNPEICVGLLQPALVTCANLKGHLKRASRVGVARLQLDVPSRRLHAPDCDGRRGGHGLGTQIEAGA